jgi:hypothetical protein
MSEFLRWMRLCMALLLVALMLSFIGNRDYADALVIEAMEKEARPQRARAYYRELLCDCLKTHRGKNLRLHIVHQPDRELCYAACVYEDGTITKGTL